MIVLAVTGTIDTCLARVFARIKAEAVLTVFHRMEVGEIKKYLKDNLSHSPLLGPSIS